MIAETGRPTRPITMKACRQPRLAAIQPPKNTPNAAPIGMPNWKMAKARPRGKRSRGFRLRHVPTGQLCVLDYSRSSPVARNRADCYGGGQARDTALVNRKIRSRFRAGRVEFSE